eukprot:CAMPEP_0201675524 /NCGR_PEP_ID=MMETSP0494-20130426/39775_1 /ASSEMBLY_ACC=CAM_ASM_000839 /TAXON_ID=420259 /ORGANISM="Thalassiosira gravida, Strain GMp14c1" /LENGTH=810 /DNA_ID=CAMNT_0048158001 /DNA_START=193 /DNA_END=2622 /DNA_ORIENTATION=-
MTMAKRTRPKSSVMRAAVAITLLHLATVSLIPSPAAAESATSGDQPDDDKNAQFQKLLESFTSDAASKLHQKPSEFHALQNEFDSKILMVQRVRDRAQSELRKLQQQLSSDDDNGDDDENSDSSLEKIHEDMNDIETNYANLIRRTEGVMAKVGEYNRQAVGGELVGLKARLGTMLKEEVGRRDRYDTSMATMAENNSTSDEDDVTEANISTADDNNGASLLAAADGTSSSSTPSTYMTQTELNALLAPKFIMSSSETTLQLALATLTAQQMQQHIETEDEMWKSRLTQIANGYQKEFTALERTMRASSKEGETCLAIPATVELVGKALVEHYRDGTNGLLDHASYERGGSVVHDLTSASYVPPPRNDGFVSAGARHDKRAIYEYEKQKMFDEQTEGMYRQQRAMLRDDDAADLSFMKQISEFTQNANPWEWYTSFKFGALRPYLPDDWERLLDNVSDRLDDDGGLPWSEYTPRGAVDSLVPDYVYHSLGMAFGRTASPEVAISAGNGKSGGSGGSEGWSSKPMGHCYPLSMDPSDDPALSLLARHTHMEGGMEIPNEDIDTSLLVGPKYTVRLPYAVSIDAVTLEHRSFPLLPSSLENGWTKGGESAPRWVRVVGFPPCPKTTDEMEEDDEDECGLRGFDLSNPIDLGLFEYQRITVTGREDDYGGDGDEDESGEKNDAWSGRRRRSIQTFAVKGGNWKPTSLFGKNDASGESPIEMGEDKNTADPTQCSGDSMSCGAPEPEEEKEDEMEPMPASGQCAPPKDEDSLPSCGDDVVVSAKISSSSSLNKARGIQQRHVVEAVSFIVEENW